MGLKGQERSNALPIRRAMICIDTAMPLRYPVSLESIQLCDILLSMCTTLVRGTRCMATEGIAELF